MDDLAFAIGGDSTIAGQGSDGDASEIFNSDGDPIASCYGNGADVVDRLQLPDGPHKQDLVVAGEAIASRVAIVLLDGLGQFADGQVEGEELVRIGCDLVGSHLAAERIDIGDSVDREETGTDDPVEDTTEFLVGEVLPLDEEHVDIGEGNRDRGEPALDSLREASEVAFLRRGEISHLSASQALFSRRGEAGWIYPLFSSSRRRWCSRSASSTRRPSPVSRKVANSKSMRQKLPVF